MEDDEPPSLIGAALATLCRTADLEGVAIIDAAEAAGPVLLHAAGRGGPDILAAAHGQLRRGGPAPVAVAGPDRRSILVCPIPVAPDRPGGIALWRAPGTRGWEARDSLFGATVAGLLRVMLDHGPGEQGIDRLTRLPNRGAFLAEADRHIERLDQDGAPGTLLLIDVDDLRRLNATHGRGAGDRVLVRLADLLRGMVRPADPVARIGPDEFAVWFDGMDHLTAAERAETLCRQRLMLPDPDGNGPSIRPTVSIGVASRSPAGAEDIRALLRRAHRAAGKVKAEGGGGWHVSRPLLRPPWDQRS